VALLRRAASGFERGERRRATELRVHRERDDRAGARARAGRERSALVGAPVAVSGGHEELVSEQLAEGPGLLLGLVDERRAAAEALVVAARLGRPPPRDE